MIPDVRMKDPYEVLGLAKTATPEEIRKAYRQLAKKLHPDLNPGDKHAEERFKEVAAANDLLSDPDKRRRYDAGEIDASGAEKAPPQGRYYREYAGAGGHPYENAEGYADFAEGNDIFTELLRRSREQQREQMRRAPGADLHYELHVPFLDAVNGAVRTITLPQGGTLDVTIPAGVEDGQTLRLKGKGAPAPGEGPPGDALVQIVVEPHAYFTREGDDIHVELPITIKEAALGGEVRAPDDDRRRDAQDPEAFEHRRYVAPQGQGREGARRGGRRIRPAQGRHAQGARRRTRCFPRRLDAAVELRSPQGDVSHDHRARIRAARPCRRRDPRSLDPRSSGSAPTARRRSAPIPRWTLPAPASSTTSSTTWASTTRGST